MITNACFAMEPSVYVPQFIEHKIIKHALVKPPYSPLTEWLVSRYRKVFPAQTHPIVVSHSNYGMGHSGIRSVAITPDGSKVITGSENGTVKIWSMADGTLIASLNLMPGFDGIYHIEISPDGSRFVTVQCNNVRIWNIDGSLVAPLSGTTDEHLYSFRISSDGSTCAAGFDHGIVKMWDMRDGTLIDTLSLGVDDTIYDISHDLSLVCTKPKFNCVKIWNLREKTLVRTIDGYSSSAKISADGSEIAIGRSDCNIWNIANGELIATLPMDAGWVDIYVISPHGLMVLRSGGAHANNMKDREIIKIWDMHTYACVATLFDEPTESQDLNHSAAVDPRGLHAVTGHEDGTFRIWTIIPSNLLATLSTLTLEQVWLLEGIYEQAIKNKKADLSNLNKPEIVHYMQQYRLLPNLIQDLVKEYIKFK